MSYGIFEDERGRERKRKRRGGKLSDWRSGKISVTKRRKEGREEFVNLGRKEEVWGGC